MLYSIHRFFITYETCGWRFSGELLIASVAAEAPPTNRTLLGGDTRIRLQPDRLHRADCALLIDIRSITGDAHCADHLAALITDQYTTRCRHQLTVCQVVYCADKRRALLCVGGDQTRALAQCQRAPGLADGDLRAQQAGAVFTL